MRIQVPGKVPHQQAPAAPPEGGHAGEERLQEVQDVARLQGWGVRFQAEEHPLPLPSLRFQVGENKCLFVLLNVYVL